MRPGQGEPRAPSPEPRAGKTRRAPEARQTVRVVCCETLLPGGAPAWSLGGAKAAGAGVSGPAGRAGAGSPAAAVCGCLVITGEDGESHFVSWGHG